MKMDFLSAMFSLIVNYLVKFFEHSLPAFDSMVLGLLFFGKPWLAPFAWANTHKKYFLKNSFIGQFSSHK